MSKTNSLFNVLDDRILWYDGSISLDPDKIVEYILSGNSIDKDIYSTSINHEISNFNKLNPNSKICVKELNEELDLSWNIPEEYKNIDIRQFIANKLLLETEKKLFSDEDIEARISRIDTEISLYEKYEIVEILKTLIYIVDTFNKHKMIWGTGRGSSCSSYLLYLIGLHDVDSVKYDLEVTEFFRRG